MHDERAPKPGAYVAKVKMRCKGAKRRRANRICYIVVYSVRTGTWDVASRLN